MVWDPVSTSQSIDWADGITCCAEAAAAGRTTARRRTLCADRDTPGRYFNVVYFDSYESAMENSNLPVTQEFAQKMMALADGAPTFYNLDVVDQRE